MPKVPKRVLKEIGKRLSIGILKKSHKVIAGHLFRDSRAWNKAFGHIADHFKRMAKHKEKHTLFNAEFRSRQGVQRLIEEAVKKMDTAPRFSDWNGHPRVIIYKKFKSAVGYTEKMVRKDGQEVYEKLEDAYYLKIVLDYTGRLVTAFPDTAMKW